MDKKPLIIANWKMNLLLNEEVGLAKQFAVKLERFAEKTEVVVCPTHLGLIEVGEILKPTKLILGAQDMAWGENWALTGGVSAGMLREAGVRYCIVGHSERRRNLGETDDMVNKKALSATSHGLTPIICVGESLDERQAGKKEVKVISQLKAALKNIKGDQPIVVSYEPIWAIGTGIPAEPSEVALMVELIHQTLVDLFSLDLIMKNFRIIYGGSIDSGNIGDFLKLRYVVGGLVGTASLNLEEFTKLVQVTKLS
ncbi:MAG: triose-phosphate isomerase [Patescibacteria group bacterium]|nr:triose-phosphate isomerase [Patescibacteria group bacterium]